MADEREIDADVRRQMLDYFAHAADFLVNAR
jgi:hypothetical protein